MNHFNQSLVHHPSESELIEKNNLFSIHGPRSFPQLKICNITEPDPNGHQRRLVVHFFYRPLAGRALAVFED